MRKLLLFLTFFFIYSLRLFGQENIHFSNDSDTSFWYEIKNGYARDFKLGLIESDTAENVFRFWSNGLTIKLRKSNNDYSGEVTWFVEKYPTKSKKKFFVKKYIIRPEAASKAFKLIDSLKIIELPSDKDINGWQQGLDGIIYFVEYKVGDKYGFKNYWTPDAQDSLSEAKLFSYFISALENLVDLKSTSRDFYDENPFDTYQYPGDSYVVSKRAKSKKKNSN